MSGKTDKKKKSKKQTKDTEVFPDSLYKEWEHPEPAEAGVDIPEEPANLPRFTQQRPSALQRPEPMGININALTPASRASSASPVSPAFARRRSSGSDSAASAFLAYNRERNLQAGQQTMLELRRLQIQNAAGNNTPPSRTTSSPYNTNPYADPHNVSDNTPTNIITQMFNSLGGFGGEGLKKKRQV